MVSIIIILQHYKNLKKNKFTMNEKFSQNDSLNEVISYDEKRFIVVKTDKSVNILTEEELKNIGNVNVISINQYSPERYNQVLNENRVMY